MMMDYIMRIVHRFPRLRYHFQWPHYRTFLRKNRGTPIQLEMGEGPWEKDFCADPFLFAYHSGNYLFYEGMSYEHIGGWKRGFIGCFKETDGKWINLGMVIKEDYHLSFPHVFETDGHIYMIPESCEAGAVLLYEAIDFPYKWEIRTRLIEGGYVDSSLLQWDGYWYIVTAPQCDEFCPCLFFSNDVCGPWKVHPQSSNVSSSPALRRNGGAFLQENNSLFRIAQDCDGAYGKRIFKIPILTITPTEYRESDKPVLLFATESDWPKRGFYHTYNSLKTKDALYEVIDSHFYTLQPLARCLQECWVPLVRRVKNVIKSGV